TGVADGAINSSSSDAINGSQLQAAGDSLASNVLGGNADYTGNDFTMSDVGGTGESTIDDAIRSANTTANAGWNVADTNGNSHNIGPNGKVTFEGDSNVTVTESGVDDDAKVQVALNDDITVDSVTTGNSTLNTNGLTVTDGSNVTEVTATGTSVTDGTNSTEYGADGMIIAGGPSVTTSGIDAAGNTVTGVADGAINSSSSDAINGSQLQAAGDSLASNVLGGNADYTGNDFTMSDVGGTGESTIDDAIRSANSAATAGWDISAQGSNPTNVGPNDSVDLNNSDGNIEVSKTAADNNVTFDLADNIDVASVTADDGAGNVTKVTATGTSVTDGTTTTTIGANNVTSGNVVVDGSQDVVSGLSNTTYDPTADYSTSDQAASEAQLGGLGDSLTADGMNFAGDSGTDVHRDLGQTLDIIGGADASGNTNITTVADNANGQLSIVMSDQPQFGNVTVNTGGGDTIDGLGNTTFDPTNVVDDRAATEGQLEDVNAVATAGWDISAQGSNPTNVGPNDSVDLNNSDGNIVVSKTAADNNVTFDLAANLTADSLTTGNSRLDTNGLTVAEGGNVTEVTATGTSVTDGTNSTEYGADGMTIAGGPSVTTSGIDAASNT
ncbi:hypothetical protein IOC61_08520, partial [Halomonas sp. KAO]|uniref:beta strand repeat-containing protein n=1 Tax=Halomonas sp. KAO TaxID=2783858 RepID=UPI001E2EB914